MNEFISNTPLTEQLICTECGFCCDGTLFDNIILQPRERESLPEKIQQQYIRKEEEFFSLPCPYFYGKCSIYDQHRPSICGDFRCQLLKDVANNKVSQENAIQIVENSITFRTELYDLYKHIFGREYMGSFRHLLVSIHADELTLPDQLALQPSISILKAKCIIFGTLLTKNFKSITDFERMLETPM